MRIGKQESSKIPKFHGYTSINRLIKRLKSGDSFKREKAIDELGEIGESYPELSDEFLKLIIEAFKDDVPEVRSSAVFAIGKIGVVEPDRINEAIIPLISRIRDNNVEVRLNAIEVIDLISSKKKGIIKKVAPYLIARLNDSDKSIIDASINCLTNMGMNHPKIVIPFIKKQLTNKKINIRYGCSVIIKNIAKGNKDEIKSAIPGLFINLKDNDQKVRNIANEAIIEIGLGKTEIVLPSLINCLVDKDREVLWWITALSSVKAIGKIAEQKQAETRPAVPMLAKCLTKDIWELRENASITLGKIGKDNLDHVIVAIPNLVHCLKDPDDLVRTATAHALDKIGVKPEEYKIIQKSSESISSSNFIVTSILNFGIGVKNADELLKKARIEFDNHRYEEAIELGVAAENEARNQEKIFRKVTDALEKTITFIEEVESYGIDANESKFILKDAKNAIENEDYELALELVSNSKTLTTKIKDGAKPELVIIVVAYNNFKVNEWSRVTTTIKNNGGTFANNIEVDFIGSLESKGSRRIPVLKTGETTELVMDILPKSNGRLPIEINISYQDYMKRGYHLTDKCQIETIGSNDLLRPEKNTLFNIRTQLPSKEIIKNKDHSMKMDLPSLKTKEIECPNCKAKMPENFRICGKCGNVIIKICPNCDNKVPVNFQFCGSCGNEIGNSCPKCRHENPKNFMFCGGCGVKLK